MSLPSRKKAKGQARKRNKAAANRNRAQDDRQQVERVRWSKGCHHDCPTASLPGQVSGFIATFWSEWKSDSNPFKAFDVAYANHPNGLLSKGNRKLVKDFFVGNAAEMILDPESYSSAWKSATGSSAGVVMLIESYDSSPKPLDVILVDLFQLGPGHMRNVDIIQGCERSLTRFFSKRTSCSCLNEKYEAIKHMPKTGICGNCNQRKKRNEMFICTGCEAHQYCSRQCQLFHWPSHKKTCKLINNALRNGVTRKRVVSP